MEVWRRLMAATSDMMSIPELANLTGMSEDYLLELVVRGRISDLERGPEGWLINREELIDAIVEGDSTIQTWL